MEDSDLISVKQQLRNHTLPEGLVNGGPCGPAILEDKLAVAVAATMLKLGEHVLTLTTADMARLLGRQLLVDQTDEGVQIKIV